jgi:CubicO group peptidase (beta-lactamase class C family)
MRNMKKKRIIQVIISILIIIIGLIVFTDNYCGRLIRWNYPDVYDYHKFPFVNIENSDHSYLIPKKINEKFFSKLELQREGETIDDFARLLDLTKTNAFIVIQNDTIIYEKYFNGRFRESLCKAFSASKSVLSLLVGIAVDEGYINSIDDPLKKYIKDFRNKELGEITIQQCLNQTTGIKYNNNMTFFSDKPKFYYSKNVRDLIKRVELENKPGAIWSTDEYSILLLGAVLESATGQSISDYLKQKLWTQIGTEYPATFSVDSKEHKFEHVADGLNATAIDFAKIGMLLLHEGQWNKKQIVPVNWINESISIIESSKTDRTGLNYKNLWWINRENGDFHAEGHFGQYIFVSPRSKVVIVRFGEKKGGVSWWYDIFPKIVDELNKQTK